MILGHATCECIFCTADQKFQKNDVDFYGSGTDVVGTHLFSVTILVGGKFCDFGSTGFDHGKTLL